MQTHLTTRRTGAGRGGAELYASSWCSWLQTLLSEDDNGGVRVNNQRVSETVTRTLYRWQVEGAVPSLWSADAFAVKHGLHIDAFFAWCESHRLPAWPGNAPWFETEPLSDGDWREIEAAWPLAGAEEVALAA